MKGAPFPICAEHAILVYRHLETVINEHAVNSVGRVNDVATVDLRPGRRGRPRAGHAPGGLTAEIMNGWPSVVYYARIGDHIKIGWTKQLHHRMRWYPPCSRLLAVEPGDEGTERIRHRQFAHLLAARTEWFAPGADLMKHIRELARTGLPHSPSGAI
jgi:hypothetical protein